MTPVFKKMEDNLNLTTRFKILNQFRWLSKNNLWVNHTNPSLTWSWHSSAPVCLSISDAPNMNLNNPNNLLIESLVYSRNTVNIKEWRNLTPGNSNCSVVLPLGKLMPSVDYFWKLVYMYILTQEKVGIGTCAVWLFPVQST